MNNTSIFTYLIGIVLIFNTMSLSVMNNENAVFNIPYTTSFRTDKINAALGCGHNIVFGNYLYPAGSRDALSLYMNPHFYGGTTVRCQFKTLFAKAFGTGQDYSELKSPETVAG